MYYYEFFKENPKLFSELRARLISKGIPIVDDIYSPGFPYVNAAHVNGLNGFYMKKQGFSDWDSSEFESINEVFPMRFDDFNIELINIEDAAEDDDRLYPSIICFAIFKNNESVLTSPV